MTTSNFAWYQHMMLYGLDVSTFRDGNNDGTGDFPGLTQSLDYLDWLGIDTVWLLPFYVSGKQDNGYDVIDHVDIDPAHGTMEDFHSYLDEARRRGIRTVIDLLVNHTSTRHPWFQEASKSRESPFHDFYVWTDDPDSEPGYTEVFPGYQHGTWKFVPDVQQYYLHRFYPYQAELNTTNPAVIEEIQKIVEFWINKGIDGFRIDAAPFLGDDRDGDAMNPHPLLRNIRNWTVACNPDAVLIAEADLPSPDLEPYFGKDGDECQLIFSFVVNQALFITLADAQADPLLRAIHRLPSPPAGCGWLGYLRNLDELTLSRLHDDERHRVLAAFAPDPDMQIYGRGIRRRLAPMLDGNQARLKMVISLLYSLPFPPMMTYGDEIGMGEDLSLPERVSVRLPMQWDAQAPNAGFSNASPGDLFRQVPTSGRFSPDKVNVENQRQDKDSLLNWVRQVIHQRKRFQTALEGAWSSTESDDPAVLVQSYVTADQVVLTAHNLSDRETSVTIPAPRGDQPEVVLQSPGESSANVNQKELTFHLPPYGCCWLASPPDLDQPQPGGNS